MTSFSKSIAAAADIGGKGDTLRRIPDANTRSVVVLSSSSSMPFTESLPCPWAMVTRQEVKEEFGRISLMAGGLSSVKTYRHCASENISLYDGRVDECFTSRGYRCHW